MVSNKKETHTDKVMAWLFMVHSGYKEGAILFGKPPLFNDTKQKSLKL